MKVLLIVPAFNESESILAVSNRISEAGYDYIVINDGSTDGTLGILETHRIPHLNLSQNLGIGGAVQAGHRYAFEHGYDVDIQFDGDGQHDIGYVAALIKEIENGGDLVIGSRFLEEREGFHSTFLRRVGIRWLSMWIRAFCGVRVTDPTSGFRACSRAAIELFAQDYPDDYPEPESIVNAIRHGLAVKETAVSMLSRQGGTSSISGLSSVYYMIKVTLAIAIVAVSNANLNKKR